jgi:hypothetical protein
MMDRPQCFIHRRRLKHSRPPNEAASQIWDLSPIGLGLRIDFDTAIDYRAE